MEDDTKSCENCYWSNILSECELDRNETKDVCEKWQPKEAQFENEEIQRQIEQLKIQIEELLTKSLSILMEREFRRKVGDNWRKDYPELEEKWKAQKKLEENAIQKWKEEIKRLEVEKGEEFIELS